MPKPASKEQLLAGNKQAFESLNELLTSLSTADLARPFPFQHRDRNVRDVLAHLLAWQQLMVGWYKTGMAGGDPDMPAEGFSWKSTPELNGLIWSNFQSIPLSEVRHRLRKSHDKLQRLIHKHTDRELFTKRFYHWTGSTSLGVYFTAAGWSHYGWALKLLKKFVKNLNK